MSLKNISKLVRVKHSGIDTWLHRPKLCSLNSQSPKGDFFDKYKLMIKLIIFDYDGVIVDSFPIFHQIYKLICKKFHKVWPANINDFKKIYGNNSLECYKNLGLNEAEQLEATQIIKQELSNYEPRVFEGIIDVLQKFHSQHKLVLISSSPEEEVERSLRKLNLYGLFDSVAGRPRHQLERFNKAERMQEAIRDAGCEPDEAILIGDRNVDFIEGTDAKIKSIILVDYGWGYNQGEIPDYKSKFTIKKPTDLLQLLS